MSSSETLTFDNARALQALYASDPQNLKLIEDRCHVKLTTRDGWLKIDGEQGPVERARNVFAQLAQAQAKGVPIRKHEIKFALEAAQGAGDGLQLPDLHKARVQVSSRKPAIFPKTATQKEYVDFIRETDLTFGIGPAGTGKTYLATAMAVAALKSESVARIILTRPAVEAGETLGFLPGDLKEKILPYLRPLYDALNDMMEPEELARAVERQTIEIAPLAYMRGRTLSNSFVILDEAQNTTTEQMFMFLTRLGQGSKCVVTGDPTQVDLPHNRKSGLVEAQQALKGTEGVAFVRFDDRDVVRHELVQRIIRAYKAHRGDRATSLTL